jgi:hypothetical protein
MRGRSTPLCCSLAIAVHDGGNLLSIPRGTKLRWQRAANMLTSHMKTLTGLSFARSMPHSAPVL